jgi:hypothetical protein
MHSITDMALPRRFESDSEGGWNHGDITKLVISVGVWPRFRDLVAHMMAQGSTVFPPLPSVPDKITSAPRKTTAEAST